MDKRKLDCLHKQVSSGELFVFSWQTDQTSWLCQCVHTEEFAGKNQQNNLNTVK